MGTYDTLTDPLLAALGTVCGNQINASLALSDGDAIRKVYLFPIALDIIPAVQAPALAIYRQSSQFLPHGPKGKWWMETLRFDYFAPKTAKDKLSVRWPLLHQVNLKLLEALCDGTWESVDVLVDAGVKHIHPDGYRTRYTYAENDSWAWPVTETTVLLDYEPVVAEEVFPAASLLAQQLRDDGTAFIVTSLHE